MLAVFVFASCANFYDAELRDEILKNRENIIDKNESLTINYAASLYRLALLGAGVLSEDAIAREVEQYKRELKIIRDKNAKNNKTKDY